MSSEFEILRLYDQLDKANKRIAELETDNSHLRNCMAEDDERIAELEEALEDWCYQYPDPHLKKQYEKLLEKGKCSQ